jgi:hypothetical protein
MIFIQRIGNYLRRKREQWFLKKHGCTTRAQYDRIYDVDYNCRATRMPDVYHGYPYVTAIDWLDDINREHTQVLNVEMLKGKFRLDWHRVSKDSNGVWYLNEICGRDYVFVAFQHESDYIWFTLRHS